MVRPNQIDSLLLVQLEPRFRIWRFQGIVSHALLRIEFLKAFPRNLGDWVIASSPVPESDLRIGIARPIREPLAVAARSLRKSSPSSRRR